MSIDFAKACNKIANKQKFRPFTVIHIGRSLLPAHNQNLPKSIPAPSHRERSCSKILKGLNDKGQLVTRGLKTLGACWLYGLLFSHQSSLYLDSEVTPKSPTFHTAIR